MLACVRVRVVVVVSRSRRARESRLAIGAD